MLPLVVAECSAAHRLREEHMETEYGGGGHMQANHVLPPDKRIIIFGPWITNRSYMYAQQNTVQAFW